MTTLQVARLAALFGAWTAFLALALPWVGRWEPRRPGAKADDAHGYWLATETLSGYAPAAPWVAVVVLVGTVALAVLAQILVVRDVGWAAGALVLLAVGMLLALHTGVELEVPEARPEPEDRHALEAGWYLWHAALAMSVVGTGAIIASEERSPTRV